MVLLVHLWGINSINLSYHSIKSPIISPNSIREYDSIEFI